MHRIVPAPDAIAGQIQVGECTALPQHPRGGGGGGGGGGGAVSHTFYFVAALFSQRAAAAGTELPTVPENALADRGARLRVLKESRFSVEMYSIGF